VRIRNGLRRGYSQEAGVSRARRSFSFG
jgi:hypothetical protein